MSKYITRIQRTTPTSPWSAESTLKFKREGEERAVLVLTARTTKHSSGAFMHHTVTAFHVVDDGEFYTQRHAVGKDLAQSVALGGDVPKRLTSKAVERIHLAAMERLPEAAALKAVKAFYKDVYPDLTLA